MFLPDYVALAKIILTLVSSTWTFLILPSTTVVKLLVPRHHFAGWFFDVDKHPVQAIGIVSGALLMLGSATISRAVI